MFVPALTKINETDLRVDFNEFARKMRCKWFFPNEPTENVNEAPAFRVNSNCNLPEGHSAIEVFLSKLETEISPCCLALLLIIIYLKKNGWQ